MVYLTQCVFCYHILLVHTRYKFSYIINAAVELCFCTVLFSSASKIKELLISDQYQGHLFYRDYLHKWRELHPRKLCYVNIHPRPNFGGSL